MGSLKYNAWSQGQRGDLSLCHVANIFLLNNIIVFIYMHIRLLRLQGHAYHAYFLEGGKQSIRHETLNERLVKGLKLHFSLFSVDVVRSD